MGATAKLHSVGESYVGYPCIEVKDIKSGLLAAPAAAAAGAADGDYSAKGVYAAKSWKVRSCNGRSKVGIMCLSICMCHRCLQVTQQQHRHVSIILCDNWSASLFC
jgi:hypothetical protein